MFYCLFSPSRFSRVASPVERAIYTRCSSGWCTATARCCSVTPTAWVNLLRYVKQQTGNSECEVVDLADETGRHLAWRMILCTTVCKKNTIERSFVGKNANRNRKCPKRSPISSRHTDEFRHLFCSMLAIVMWCGHFVGHWQLIITPWLTMAT